QRLPSGPAAMKYGVKLPPGTEYSVITPAVVTLATLLPFSSVNQRLPSGPAAMPYGTQPNGTQPAAVGIGYLVKAPEVVTLATLPFCSVNQRFPSGPAVMPNGVEGILLFSGMRYSVISPTAAWALPALRIITPVTSASTPPAARPRLARDAGRSIARCPP